MILVRKDNDEILKKFYRKFAGAESAEGSEK